MSFVPSMPLISSYGMRPWAGPPLCIVQESFLSVYFWFTTYLFLLAVQLKFAKQEASVFLVFDDKGLVAFHSAAAIWRASKFAFVFLLGSVFDFRQMSQC